MPDLSEGLYKHDFIECLHPDSDMGAMLIPFLLTRKLLWRGYQSHSQSLGKRRGYFPGSIWPRILRVWLLCHMLWCTCPNNNRLWTRQAKCLWWSSYSSVEWYWIDKEEVKHWGLWGHFWFGSVFLQFVICDSGLAVGWLVLFHREDFLFFRWKTVPGFSNTKMPEQSSGFWTEGDGI